MKTERHLAQAQAQGGKCSYMRAAVGFLFWVFQGHFSTISLWQVLAQWFLGLTFPDWKGSIGSLSPDALWVRSIEWLQISQTAHPQCCPSRWRAWPGKTLQHEDNRICTDLACRQEALIPWLSAAALGCQVEAKRTQQLNEWPRAHFTPGRTQATVNTADWAGRWGGEMVQQRNRETIHCKTFYTFLNFDTPQMYHRFKILYWKMQKQWNALVITFETNTWHTEIKGRNF